MATGSDQGELRASESREYICSHARTKQRCHQLPDCAGDISQGAHGALRCRGGGGGGQANASGAAQPDEAAVSEKFKRAGSSRCSCCWQCLGVTKSMTTFCDLVNCLQARGGTLEACTGRRHAAHHAGASGPGAGTGQRALQGLGDSRSSTQVGSDTVGVRAPVCTKCILEPAAACCCPPCGPCSSMLWAGAAHASCMCGLRAAAQAAF